MAVHPDRIVSLAERPPPERARYVLYWMQQAQRVAANPALEVALHEAQRAKLPLLVCFGLMDDYPEANLRHYAFLIEGLRDVAKGLARHKVPFVVKHGAPFAPAIALSGEAALLVCDRGYTRHQKAWRATVAEKAKCPVIQVETDVVVPVDRASSKHEYAARTLRPKVTKLVDTYLDAPLGRWPDLPALADPPKSDFDVTDVTGTLKRLKLDRSVGPVKRFTGGEAEAAKMLESFVAEALSGYADGRNDPTRRGSSLLSPYLHYGHIAPVTIAQAVRAARPAGNQDRLAFLEELIVRRELAMNHAEFTPDYDRYAGLPDWARKTLAKHEKDERTPSYGEQRLVACETDDPAWNAAMREMRETGYMHNYLRMYWGKKILEWSKHPEQAFETTLAINNRYFLDGRDPNSFTNVGWLFGLHDRPWGERPIYGTVRSMSAAGLKRKFDVEGYIARVAALAEEET